MDPPANDLSDTTAKFKSATHRTRTYVGAKTDVLPASIMLSNITIERKLVESLLATSAVSRLASIATVQNMLVKHAKSIRHESFSDHTIKTIRIRASKARRKMTRKRKSHALTSRTKMTASKNSKLTRSAQTAWASS